MKYKISRISMSFFALTLNGVVFADPVNPSAETDQVQSIEPLPPVTSQEILIPKKDSIGINAKEYKIGAFDLLEISVFQSPDLSRTVRVNSRGEINLPLIGVVQAGGKSSYELEVLIADKYGEKYLQSPQVGVFIKEYTSQKITVEGNVKKAGVFPITGRTTLMQVIAMASGPDALANVEEVKVYRINQDGTKEIFVYNLAEIRDGKKSDPEVLGDDIVVVGESGGKAVLKGLTDTLRGFIGFGNPL